MTGRDVTTSFARTLVDEWVRSGLTHAVVSPGSRNTPLVLALARELPLELAELDVPSHRHPVAHVFVKECEPLLVSPLVEKLCLPVQEALDLLL